MRQALDTGSLRIARATRAFDGVPAVEDFDLDIGAGEFVSLLGPSGCGKTTLLRMIAGFELPDAGRILLDGRDITTLPPHRRPVNMVFQRVTLFPQLDVFENIAFGLRLKRVARREVRARVLEALDLVRLPGFERRRPQTLSGGQAQRVALARAIVNRPKVLLFDEPLSALDLQIRRELQGELKDIHRELQGTFVYVTHDQEEAMSMSDRVVVMRAGHIVQAGPPAELYRRPATLFVASFVGSPNVWRGRVAELHDDAVQVDVGGRRHAAPRPPGAAVGDEVALVLRSEAVALGPGAAGDEQARGTVIDARFLGAVVHYRIELEGGSLTVTRPSSDDELLREGDPVTVAWRVRDTLLLRSDEAPWSEPAPAPPTVDALAKGER